MDCSDGTCQATPATNCQHTVSWVTTGKASSFQSDVLLGLGAIVVLPSVVAAAIDAIGEGK